MNNIINKLVLNNTVATRVDYISTLGSNNECFKTFNKMTMKHFE